VTLEGRVILVRRSQRKGRVSKPKSGKARRVDMSGQLTTALRDHKSLQEAEAALPCRGTPGAAEEPGAGQNVEPRLLVAQMHEGPRLAWLGRGIPSLGHTGEICRGLYRLGVGISGTCLASQRGGMISTILYEHSSRDLPTDISPGHCAAGHRSPRRAAIIARCAEGGFAARPGLGVPSNALGAADAGRG
jgi:hypothetical protein